MRSALRLLLVLTLALALPASSVAAPTSQGVERDHFTRSILDHLRSVLIGIWSDIGCRVDPNERCPEELDQSDIGCHVDPNGGCRD